MLIVCYYNVDEIVLKDYQSMPNSRENDLELKKQLQSGELKKKLSGFGKRSGKDLKSKELIFVRYV